MHKSASGESTQRQVTLLPYPRQGLSPSVLIESSCFNIHQTLQLIVDIRLIYNPCGSSVVFERLTFFQAISLQPLDSPTMAQSGDTAINFHLGFSTEEAICNVGLAN